MKSLMVVVGLLVLAAPAVAFAQDTTGPLGIPASAKLKETCGLDDEQVKKIEAIFTEYKPKAEEAQKKVKDAQDKKAAGQEVRTLRTEIVGKIKEVGKDDEQKKKLEDACAQQRKKKNNNQ